MRDGQKKVSFKANSFIVLINYHCKKFQEKKIEAIRLILCQSKLSVITNLKTI